MVLGAGDDAWWGRVVAFDGYGASGGVGGVDQPAVVAQGALTDGGVVVLDGGAMLLDEPRADVPALVAGWHFVAGWDVGVVPAAWVVWGAPGVGCRPGGSRRRRDGGWG
ncbi:MAG TPA: hypothetical protein VJY40_01150 [Corynebacterium sp.]|nr:hypothetical protein [Corynebacterium sp.]